jgi:hypothetical protein
MLLSELITAFKSVALSHKDIESFAMGDDYLIEANISHQYPKFFLETPFEIVLPEDKRKQYYSVSFAFLVLMNKKEDNIDDQIQGISDAALITEQIIKRVEEQYENQIVIESTVSLTYNDMTNEGLSTCRTDITVLLLQNQCDTEVALGEIFTK